MEMIPHKFGYSMEFIWKLVWGYMEWEYVFKLIVVLSNA